jgi:hypothetical protein
MMLRTTGYNFMINMSKTKAVAYSIIKIIVMNIGIPSKFNFFFPPFIYVFLFEILVDRIR